MLLRGQTPRRYSFLNSLATSAVGAVYDRALGPLCAVIDRAYSKNDDVTSRRRANDFPDSVQSPIDHPLHSVNTLGKSVSFLNGCAFCVQIF